MMDKIENICSEIVTGPWTADDLNRIATAIQFKRQVLARDVKRSLAVGDTVRWTSEKHQGKVYQGKVSKIAVKYVSVLTVNGGAWRVPASMLTKV